jgi:hypothetical protein
MKVVFLQSLALDPGSGVPLHRPAESGTSAWRSLSQAMARNGVAVFDSGGRPMEHAEVHCVSSRFTRTLDLRRGTA